MNKLGFFALGGAIGAGIALLSAPRPGDETRAIVTDWASNAVGDKNEYTTRLQVRGEQIAHDAGLVANQAATLAQAGVQKAKEAVSGGQIPVPPFAKKEEKPAAAAAPADDELRARINQARERIAQQVAENAANAREAAGGAIPTVQEAAKDVAARVKETAAAAGEAVKGAKEDAKAE